MSEVNPVVDALAAILEPAAAAASTDDNGSRTVVADSGATVDLNARRPIEYDADHLYLWPTRHEHRPEGAGNPPEDREDWAVQCIYAVGREGEEPQLQARRDVSDSLDTRATAYLNRLRLQRVNSPLWQDLSSVVVQHDTVVTFGVRGIGLLVTGYRYVN